MFLSLTVTLSLSLWFCREGVNVTYQSRPGTPPLSSTQLLVNPELEEFQLVDLSRRFLILDSYWTLPRQFLGNKVKQKLTWLGPSLTSLYNCIFIPYVQGNYKLVCNRDFKV